VALGFLAGAFLTQRNDKLISIHDLANGVARSTHPWYWDMPLAAWIGYAVLLLVIIIICQVAIGQNPNRDRATTRTGSDGPVK
jgi:NADH:ubiquinone oxidoreductase subunit 6 (subunit J)